MTPNPAPRSVNPKFGSLIGRGFGKGGVVHRTGPRSRRVSRTTGAPRTLHRPVSTRDTDKTESKILFSETTPVSPALGDFTIRLWDTLETRPYDSWRTPKFETVKPRPRSRLPFSPEGPEDSSHCSTRKPPCSHLSSPDPIDAPILARTHPGPHTRRQGTTHWNRTRESTDSETQERRHYDPTDSRSGVPTALLATGRSLDRVGDNRR